MSYNTVISNKWGGIRLGGGDSTQNVTGNLIIGNMAANNVDDGIGLEWSENNTVRDNILIGNNGNPWSEGISLYHSNRSTIINNSALNNINGIGLLDSHNNTISWNSVSSNNNSGISLSSSSNNMLSSNKVSNNNGAGIFLDHSNSSTISSNDIFNNNGSGLFLPSSSSNLIENNNISNNTVYGIHLFRSDPFSLSTKNILRGNNVSNNEIGIVIGTFSSENNITGNNVSSNKNFGISLSDTSNNTIYNNIFNNTNNFYFPTSNINTWNTTLQSSPNIINGSYLGGNVWANPAGTGFSQTCADGNKDGICDSAYTLNSNNIDYLPLAFVSAMPVLNISANRTKVTAGTATIVTFTVTSNRTAVSGATVTLSGNATGSAATDANGSAVISVNATGAGAITATASRNGYTNGTTIITATTIRQEVLSYYRSLGINPNKVETTDLLKAADDWSRNITAPGFAYPITTQELLTLADEWARS